MKKTGPIILEKPGWIEVYAVKRDAMLIEDTLLDSQDHALAFDSSNNRSFDIDGKIIFTNLRPGIYYVFVQTDGLDEINVYAMGRYTVDILPEVKKTQGGRRRFGNKEILNRTIFPSRKSMVALAKAFIDQS